MPPKLIPEFEEGEKVLCFQGPLIYEAKCLAVAVKAKQAWYYMHYAGWNKNWDEWVPESRVLKYNEANIQKQKDLQRTHKTNPQKNKKSSKRSREGGGKESDSRASAPSQEETTPAEGKGPAATPSCQDSSSDVPRGKNKKSIKRSRQGGGKESDSRDFTPSQEKPKPSEGQGPAATPSCQDSSSDIPRRKKKKPIKRSRGRGGKESDNRASPPSQEETTPAEGQGPAATPPCQDSSSDVPRRIMKSIIRTRKGRREESDSRAFTPSQEKTTPSEGQGPAATPSCQDSSSDVPRRENMKFIERSREGGGKESDSRGFTPSQEKTTPSEGQGPAATPSCQDSSSDVPRGENMKFIERSREGGGKESDSRGFTPSQEKTTPSEGQGPAATPSCQDSSSDIPCIKKKKPIKRSREGDGKESDSRAFTPSQEKTTRSEGQGPSATPSCQDSSSDVPRGENMKFIERSREGGGKESDSRGFTPSQEKTTPSEGQGPAATPSCQDSSSDIARRKKKKPIKWSREGDGKESDSRACTPSQEKTTPSEGQGPAATPSCQDSSSDVPRRIMKSIIRTRKGRREESDSRAFTPSQEKTTPSEGQGPAATPSCQDSSSDVPRGENMKFIERSREGGGKESDSRGFTPSQEKTIPSEGQGPAATPSCQDSSSDVPRGENMKFIERSREGGGKESDSRGFIPSQEKTTPSEGQGLAATPSCQDSSSDVPRGENMKFIERSREGGGKESDSRGFTPSQEKTTPSKGQGPVATPSCQDSSSDVPRGENMKFIERSREGGGKESDSRGFTPSQEKTTPSECQGPAATPSCQDSSSDVPRGENMKFIERSREGGGEESDSRGFTPSQEKTTPSEGQGPAATPSCQDSSSDVPRGENMKFIERSREGGGKESDSRGFTPFQEKTTPSEGQGLVATPSCQDSSSDVPRGENMKFIERSREEGGKESDSRGFTPSQEKTTPSEGQGPAATPSCQDSSSDVPRRENMKFIERSREGGGKESDSRGFTPSQEKTTPSESQGPATTPSCQDSSSDIPRSKKKKPIKRSIEGDGKESDSRAFTPSQEKTTPSEGKGPAATPSCQDSSSDVPHRKKKKSIERSREGGGKESDSRDFTPSQGKTTRAKRKVPRKKCGRLYPTVKTEEPFLTKVEFKVNIPDELKPWLVDDNDCITKQRKLVDLPAKISVHQIFENYVKHKTSIESYTPDKEAVLLDVTNGLKEYFNVMLGSQLLYRFERFQYAEILQNHPDTPMSKVYGAIHLLRLFVKLESMLPSIPVDKKGIQMLLAHVHDFLRYLHKNAASLFSLHDYGFAPREYHRMAM